MTLIYGALAAAALVWLTVRLVRRAAALVRWHRAAQPYLRRYLTTLLLPLAIWTAPLAIVAEAPPVPEEQLSTVQGAVTAYQTNTRSTGRHRPAKTYLEGLYLDGSPVCYLLPGNGFDPEDTLARLGGTVTLGCGPDGQVYSLTAGDGAELLAYPAAARVLWRYFWMMLACVVGLFLAGAGWALGLPPKISGGSYNSESARITTILFLAAYLFLFALWFAPFFSATNRAVHDLSVSAAVAGIPPA